STRVTIRAAPSPMIASPARSPTRRRVAKPRRVLGYFPVTETLLTTERKRSLLQPPPCVGREEPRLSRP
ncbi:hypothetical protein, partial [Dokdonella sp.]|uniref:hypothetical protein n=1 Tax=Dokdonella sp. TaxID=2291710 RepID=UPI0027BA27D7